MNMAKKHKHSKIKHRRSEGSRPRQVLVICSETEEEYLKAFCHKCNIKNLKYFRKEITNSIKPNLPNADTFNYLKDQLIKKDKVYQSIYHIFDMEDVNDTAHIQGMIQHIQNCKKPIEIDKHKIKVYTCPQVPCIEAWFLLHFEVLSAPSDSGKDCERKLESKKIGYAKNKTKDWSDIINNTQDAINMYDSTAKTRKTDNAQLNTAGITQPDMHIVHFIKDIVSKRVGG